MCADCDAHAYASVQVTGRFNERFILSLANCPSCIFMDDELNILPLSTHVRTLAPVPPGSEADPEGAGGPELRELRTTLQDVQPAGPLLECCRSLDQARDACTCLRFWHVRVRVAAHRGV